MFSEEDIDSITFEDCHKLVLHKTHDYTLLQVIEGPETWYQIVANARNAVIDTIHDRLLARETYKNYLKTTPKAVISGNFVKVYLGSKEIGSILFK